MNKVQRTSSTTLPSKNAVRESKHFRTIKQELKVVDDLTDLFRLIAKLMSKPTQVKFKVTEYDQTTGKGLDGTWVNLKDSVKAQVQYLPNIGEIEGVRLNASMRAKLDAFVKSQSDVGPCLYTSESASEAANPHYLLLVEATSICTYADHFGSTYSKGILFKSVKSIIAVL